MNEDLIIDWGDFIQIPDDTYDAKYLSHETVKGSFGSKLKIRFEIISMGDHFGKKINSWYNVKDEYSPTGKNRTVRASRLSKYVGDMLAVADPKSRTDRLSPKLLKDSILKIETRTVKKNSKQKNLHNLQQYSVVNKIIGKVSI